MRNPEPKTFNRRNLLQSFIVTPFLPFLSKINGGNSEENTHVYDMTFTDYQGFKFRISYECNGKDDNCLVDLCRLNMCMRDNLTKEKNLINMLYYGEFTESIELFHEDKQLIHKCVVNDLHKLTEIIVNTNRALSPNQCKHPIKCSNEVLARRHTIVYSGVKSRT